MSRFLLLPVLVLAAGCTLFSPGSSEEVSDLAQARARWEATDWSDYDLRVMRGCFCIGAGEFDVWIRDDQVAAVWGEEGLATEIRPDAWQYFPTIDDLLDLADRALREADEVTIEWDDRGWPSRLDIDWIAGAVDDEISYQVRSVERAHDGDLVLLAPGDRYSSGSESIRFDAITEDSRCPGWALCIWAGRASARFTVTLSGSDPFTVDLVDVPATPSDERTVVVGSLRVTLLAVEPYPMSAEEPIADEDYRVSILVESL